MVTEVNQFWKSSDGKLSTSSTQCNGVHQKYRSELKVFKEAYIDFATVTQLTEKVDEIQAATVKAVMGKECQQILSCLELSNKDKKKPNKILEKLEEYFACTRDLMPVFDGHGMSYSGDAWQVIFAI